MSKIIIHNESPIPDTSIVENYILPIMKEGKISEIRNGMKQYCFATRFRTGIVVESTTNKDGTTDTFKVFLEEDNKKDDEIMSKPKLEWYVLLHDFNNDKIIKYNVLDDDYIIESLKKAVKKGEVTNKDQVTEFLKGKFMARYWSRTEYEILVSGLFKSEQHKIDAWYQIEMNLNHIVDYMIDKLNLNI